MVLGPDGASLPTFGVLGPLIVQRDGRPIGIGGPKERVVAAQLLVRANSAVSVDQLVEGLWAGRPPRSAERTLQAYVARLRGALEPNRARGEPSSLLRSEGSGYRLQVEPEQLDALLFEDLARRGAAQLQDGDAAASVTLREALALWRGDAYGEFEGVDACEAEARRLAELRLSTREDWFEAELARGCDAELVGGLEAAVAEDPFRERQWRQLMIALYRAGRQRDALVAYQRCRSVLVEQLGIEPGADVRALEAAILEQDPKLDRVRFEVRPAAGVIPPALEAAGPAFVGRDGELSRLRSAWVDAADGRGALVSVLGEEGMGKTRLVAELAREVQRTGGGVLYARCGHPYQGVRTLLDELVRSGGAALGTAAWAPLEELGGSVARLLAGRSLDRPTLVAIDDLHEADAGTLEVLADLAEWSGAASLLVVTVFRTAPSADDGVALAGTGAQVVLGGLDRDSIFRVCEIYAVDAWSAEDITQLAARTGGVPLLVHELASEWARARKTDEVEEATSRAVTARARLAVSRGEIAASVEGLQHLLEQRRAHMAGRDAPESDDLGVWTRCPYKGLVTFEPEDTSIFFGRERLVAELLARLAGTPLLAVVGPSGSGKSSLVRAGVVPALTAGLLPVAGGWRPTILPAGPRPAQALRHVEAVAGGGGRRMLFIDQFEEVLATCASDDERTELVGGIVAMAGCPDTVVVLAIRADHLGRCAAYPALAELITGNDVLVGPMDGGELRRAIERPAHLAGCALEPGLVDVIVADVAGRPGALPLLSTALAETWQRRTNRVLTHDGYRSAGGVNGALARLAEEAYRSLAPAHQLAMRRLLVRLSDAGDDADLHLRRRLPLSELSIDTDDPATRGGLDVLVERRLLTVDHDAVELTHEALLREWPRLRGWLDEDVQGRRLHRRLGEAAREWKDSGNGRAELYRGTRLDAAVDWAATHDIDVSDAERAFLEASAQEARREVDQAHRIAVDKARSNRRLRWLLGAAAVLLVVAVLAGLLTLRQRRRADSIARDATARELAAQSELALDEDPELAVLLGIEAIRTTRSAGQAAVPEAVAALQRATQANRLVYRTDGASFVDASPDGRLVATQSHENPNDVIVRDADSGRTVATLAGSQEAWSTRFSPDGRLLAVSHVSAINGTAAVVVWDTATWTATGRLSGPPRQYRALAFSAGGDVLAATSELDGTPSLVSVWDVDTSQERLSFEPGGGAAAIEFLGDTETLVVTEPNEARVGFYSTEDGALVDQLATPGIVPWDLALEPGGDRLAISSEQSRLLQVWDLRRRRRELSIPVVDTGPLTWAPEGELIAMTGANEGTVRIIAATTGKDVYVLRGSDSYASDVAFVGPDRLASVSERDLRLWDVTADGPPELRAVAASSGRVWNIQTSPDGAELLVQTIERGVELLDAETGELLAARANLLVGELGFRPDASADWRYFGSIDAADGSASVYDLATLAPISDLPPCTSPTAFSPDGTMIVLDGRSMVCTPWLAAPPKFDPPPSTDLRSRIIEVRSGNEILDLGRRRIFDAAFHPDGRYLAVNVENLAVEIYDIDTRRLVTSFDVPDNIYTLEWDRAGRWLAGGTGGGRVWALDFSAITAGTAAEDAFVLDRHAHDGGIPDLTLSRDGTLVTVGFAGELRFWDIASGALLLELQTQATDAPPTVEFAPDDRHLIYTDAGVIRRYPLDTDELITLADQVVTRSLTIEECRRYLATSECS